MEYWRYGKLLFYKSGAMPVYLVHFVTRRCDARCKHCFVPGLPVKSSDELSLEEIAVLSKHLGNNLYSVILTGGEPFMREDLAEIVGLYFKNSHAQVVQIATNGSFTENIVELTRRILNAHHHKQLGVVVSIDGIGEVHDEIRGVRGIFDRAVATYERLKRVQRAYSNLNLGVNVTVSYWNQHQLLQLYEFLTNRLGVYNVFTTLTRGNPREKQAKQVDIGKYGQLNRVIAKDLRSGQLKGYRNILVSDIVNAQNILTRRRVAKTLRENRYISPCFGGSLSGVIYPDGDVTPCEMLDEPMGNLREQHYDLEKLWTSGRVTVVRRAIEARKCFCTHECTSICNVVFNPRFLPALIKELAWLNLARLRRLIGIVRT